VRSPVVFSIRLSKVYGRCINCNIPLPVAQIYIKKYGLPPDAIMSDRELADMANPLIPGGGLLALVSGSSPEDALNLGWTHTITLQFISTIGCWMGSLLPNMGKCATVISYQEEARYREIPPPHMNWTGYGRP
jgi:hypothetical protein